MNRNKYSRAGYAWVLTGLLLAGGARAQELPQPMTREAGEKLPPEAVTHDKFLRAVIEHRKVFDRVYCEGDYEYHADASAEPVTGRFRCWHYFRDPVKTYPRHRFVRFEMDGPDPAVWVVGEDRVLVLHQNVMLDQSWSGARGLRPEGPGMPMPPALALPPPGGYGLDTYHALLHSPRIKRSHSEDGDVLTLFFEVLSRKVEGLPQTGSRQVTRFHVTDGRWLPIACTDMRVEDEKPVAPPRAPRTHCEAEYVDGHPALLTWLREPEGERVTYTIDKWTPIKELDTELFADVTRKGWDPRENGLTRYRPTTVVLENGSGVGAWAISRFEDGKFKPVGRQWTGMARPWHPAKTGIATAVESLLQAVDEDKVNTFYICDTDEPAGDEANEDATKFLDAVRKGLDAREITHRAGDRWVLRNKTDSHRLTLSVRECYDGTLLHWFLHAPQSKQATACEVWIDHPGQVPPGGEVTAKGPPGALRPRSRPAFRLEGIPGGQGNDANKKGRTPTMGKPRVKPGQPPR
jgi:hypothetical protein